MVYPCRTALKGCLSVALANCLALLNWKGDAAVIQFQPEQLHWNNHLPYTELGRYFLALVIHYLHVMVRNRGFQVIQEPVSTYVLCFCFLQLGFVIITLSICAGEYTKFMLIGYTVLEFGLHTLQGRSKSICGVLLNISFVLIVATIRITMKLRFLWIIPILFSVFGLAIMYLSIAFRKQDYLRIFQPLVCFVLSLLYCMAYVDNAHPMKF